MIPKNEKKVVFREDDMRAATEFVQKIENKRDRIGSGRASMWYSWAVVDAFIAGVKYARGEK